MVLAVQAWGPLPRPRSRHVSELRLSDAPSDEVVLNPWSR